MGTKKTTRGVARYKLRCMIRKWSAEGKSPQCVYCGQHIFSDRNPLTVDHIVPLSKGGSSDRTNLVPCCFKCNKRKDDSVWDVMYESFY